MSTNSSEDTNTNVLLEHATLSFHNNIPKSEDNDVHIFGMIELKAATLNRILVNNLELYLNIDISGSMDDLCKDKRSKMFHIRNIIQNLLKQLYKLKETNIAVIVKGFESIIHDILDIENIISLSDENFHDEVITKIGHLFPLNLTNIEAALKVAAIHMDHAQAQAAAVAVDQAQAQAVAVDQEQAVVKETKKLHILLTDGNATEGRSDPIYLKTLMPSKCANIILGLGTDYDARALRIISDNNFKHINEAETAGFCVGEIIHAFVYEALKDVVISVTNGVIFNYKTNTWSSELCVASIASEQTKNYSIMSATPDSVIVKIRCTSNGVPFEHIISENIKTDLTMYHFRQEVMELLYKASEVEQSISEANRGNYMRDLNILINDLKDDSDDLDDIYRTKEEIEYKEKSNLDITKAKRQNIKRQMKQQLIRILRYMEQNNLNDDPFYITLCMDIKVAFESIGKRNADVYISSRITSQGHQESYTCDTIDNEEVEEEVEVEVEEVEVAIDKDAIEESDINDDELLSKFNLSIRQTMNSPYSTPQQVSLMRGVSSMSDNEEEYEEEDEEEDE